VLRLSRQVLMPFAPSAHTDEENAQWVAQHLIPGGGVTVAEHAGQVVGVLAGLQPGRSALDRSALRAPVASGRGCGRQPCCAMRSTIGAAALPVRLYTFQANHHARVPSTNAHGFRAVAFSDGQGNEEKCPDVLYERPSAPAA
jgi:hypothetical protein